MLLSDRDILAEIEAGSLALDPFDADAGPAVEHRRAAGPVLPGVQQLAVHAHRPGAAAGRPDHAGRAGRTTTPFVLHPGEFVLGSTLEVVTLPDDLAGRLEGKSSLGRLGLLTHSTAGFIDPGFTGHITLELSNVANLPITLWPGMKIGQLCLFRLSSPAEHPYGSAAVRLALPGPARPDAVPVVPELPAGPHQALTAAVERQRWTAGRIGRHTRVLVRMEAW